MRFALTKLGCLAGSLADARRIGPTVACAALGLLFGCAKVVDAGGGGGNGGHIVYGGVGGSAFGAGGRPSADCGIRPDTGGGDTACMQESFTFDPKIPTVFVLVDQSGSMFKCRSGGAMDATGRECANHADTAWYPLRDGVLQVINDPTLATTVRFGFSSFGGEANGSPACPAMNPVQPALNNGAAIASAYNALVAPMKGETPSRQALDAVGRYLAADNAPGDKYILFVTDGEPDYCDDGNATCPPDSVVGGLQTLYSAGKVTTLVFGINSPLTTISGPVLQAFANAGAGQPVLPPLDAGKQLRAYFDECGNVGNAGWLADFAKTGKTLAPGISIGDYATTGGTATLYRPDPTNQQALITQFSSALAGVKSCTFDLNGLQHPLKVNLSLLNLAHVKIEGVEIPYGTGWQMNGDTQLELIGDACATWRKPESKTIDFQFPCEVIIPG